MVRGDGAATPQRRPAGPGISDDALLLLVLRRAVVQRLRARAIREERKLENAVEEPLERAAPPPVPRATSLRGCGGAGTGQALDLPRDGQGDPQSL
jgi:hypothetical protein